MRIVEQPNYWRENLKRARKYKKLQNKIEKLTKKQEELDK